MRISDWSSDVFSSDLISVREIDAGNAQALYVCLYIATMFILGLPLKAALYFYRVFAASQDSDAVEALLPMPDAAIDRKSVVQGKSVSVRVDLGGRPIIQNTQHQTRFSLFTHTI